MEKIQILIVEDEPIIAADLEDRLVEMGYRVLGPVGTGEDALAFFEQELAPDLVLMDVQLDGEWDGIETTRRIREKYELPIIFLTSNSDDQTFNEAKKVNPQAFLSKPYRGRDLKHAIELAIRQSAVKPALAEETAVKEFIEEEDTFLMKDRMFLKVKDRMVRIFFKDILWIAADDYYCKVITKDKEFLVTQTLKKFSDEIMEVHDLMRVHRSYIVNLHHVEEIGEIYLHIGQQKIPYSKSFKEELLLRIQKI